MNLKAAATDILTFVGLGYVHNVAQDYAAENTSKNGADAILTPTRAALAVLILPSVFPQLRSGSLGKYVPILQAQAGYVWSDYLRRTNAEDGTDSFFGQLKTRLTNDFKF